MRHAEQGLDHAIGSGFTDEGVARRHAPEVDDYASEENPVRAIEAFVDALDLAALGFAGMVPETTGRPARPSSRTRLKICLYGHLNRAQSGRRLERETQRNLELRWLTGWLTPDFKTIADFRKDNGPAIRATCRQLVLLCRRLDLFSVGGAPRVPGSRG
jgi:transposase